MTRTRGKSLTAAFVRTVNEPGKYHDNSRMGLYLRVEPNSSRFWVQRVMINGHRREIGLGSPPVVSLADAREQAIENKRLIRSNRDPIAEKRRSKSILTFEQAARETHKELSPTWKNQKDRNAFLNTLNAYVFPYFGDVPLPDVTSADVRRAILVAREKVPGVARKLTYRISAVFKWGIAEGMCTSNPAVADALALPKIERKPQHRKALPYSEVSHCIDAVKASGAWLGTKWAFEFLVLTAGRSGEIRNARWDEFRIEENGTAVWEIPAERMKMKRSHRVPLCDRAVEILREAEAVKDEHGLVFPSPTGKVLSDMTLSKLVKELGFDADVHGFRTSFRTWVQEQTDYPREIAETALAHAVGDAAEQAYARSDVFEKRRAMMDDWAKYLA